MPKASSPSKVTVAPEDIGEDDNFDQEIPSEMKDPNIDAKPNSGLPPGPQPQNLSPFEKLSEIGGSFGVVRSEIVAFVPESEAKRSALKKLDAAEKSALRAVLQG